MKNIAIIDLGTNTFNLLIADEKGSPVFNEKLAVKLGKGGISKGLIAKDAFQRALDAMVLFKSRAEDYDVDHIYAIATSAVRNAGNGRELVQKVKEESGIEIKVISGDEEAELIYYGVRSALNLGLSKSLIIDIGGGSVEFIIGNKDEIFWKQSFEIGAQRLLDKFHKIDPISPQQISDLNDFLEGALPPLFNAVKIHSPGSIVGSSGTFDTLAEIDIILKNKNIDYGNVTEYSLEYQEFEKISKEIISKNRTDRMKIPGMIEMRVDMIVVACILIDFVSKKINTQEIRISSYALKEGILSKVLSKNF